LTISDQETKEKEKESFSRYFAEKRPHSGKEDLISGGRVCVDEIVRGTTDKEEISKDFC
jgi:hypothetical protein